MHSTTWIELNSEALRHNAGIVRHLAPNANILAMVKANGYGHGADWVAQTLGNQVNGFGVARFNEAKNLRSSLPRAQILLLGTACSAELLQDCAALKIEIVVHSLAVAELITELSLSSPLNIWLKLNVGMNRLGMNTGDYQRAHRILSESANVADIIHMSHFSDAETSDTELTLDQAEILHTVSRSLGKQPISMANSAAIISHPSCHHDWVRPGIMLYGDDPCHCLQGTFELRPVMNFKAKVIAVRDIAAGEGVGYNRRWRAQNPARIATIAAGYADGYPRQAPDGTPVLINEQMAAIAGRVSMDLLTVDVSHLPNTKVGDVATLWGDGLPAAEVGRHCATISYELFTRITDRVERRIG
jgi:alanine racemase